MSDQEQEQIQGSQGTPRSQTPRSTERQRPSVVDQDELMQSSAAQPPRTPGVGQQQQHQEGVLSSGNEYTEPSKNDVQDADENYEEHNQQEFSGMQQSQDDFLYDEEVTKHIEKEKLMQIHQASNNLRFQLSKYQGRCPICTLMPPCKHVDQQTGQVHKPQKPPMSQFSSHRPSQQPMLNQQDSLFQMSADQQFTQRNDTQRNFVTQPGTTRGIGKNNFDGRSVSIGNNSLDISKITAIQHDTSIMNSQVSGMNDDLDYAQYTPRKAQFHVKHKADMARIQNQGRTAGHVNEEISPYSILRASTGRDVDDSIQDVTMLCGPRSTRAQLLRQLALKKKVNDNPFLNKGFKMTKKDTDQLGVDPHINDNNMNNQAVNGTIFPKGVLPHQLNTIQGGNSNFIANQKQIVRMRNKRGQYQSIDAGGGLPQVNPTARGNSQNIPFRTNRASQFTNAENRLKVIDQISAYREEKIKKEFVKLEEELAVEDERQQKQFDKELKMRAYHDKQKDRLEEYGKLKYQRAQDKVNKKRMEMENEINQNKNRNQNNEELKQKIRMYKEYKAQQILELQMREQNIIASSNRIKKPKYHSGGSNNTFGGMANMEPNGSGAGQSEQQPHLQIPSE